MNNQDQFWRAIPALLLAIAIQTTWLSRVEILGVHLDLPLLVALSVALLGGVERGAWAGLGAGILTGFFAPWHFGSFLVSRTASGAAFGFFRRGFSTDNPFAPPICALGGTVLADLVFLIMSPTDFSPLFWARHALIAGGLHMIAIWPIHWALARLLKPPSRLMFA